METYDNEITLPYEKKGDTYIVSDDRKAHIAPNGLWLSYTEAASLPLGDLLERYSDYEEDTGYDLQYPSKSLKAFMDEEIPNILYSTGLYITANRKLQPEDSELLETEEYRKYINTIINSLNNELGKIDNFIMTESELDEMDQILHANGFCVVPYVSDINEVRGYIIDIAKDVSASDKENKSEIILQLQNIVNRNHMYVCNINMIFDEMDLKQAIKIVDYALNLANIAELNEYVKKFNDIKYKLPKLKIEKLQARILDDRMADSIKSDVAKIEKKPIFKDCALMLDSGGHQIYMNYLKKRNVETYIKRYFKLLNEQEMERVNLAFSLDIHMDYPLIHDPKEIWELNCKSIEEMYKHDISKIIWVYQFRGAGLNAIWNALHEKYKIFEYMNKFAIGGVAKANKVGAINFPIFIPASTSIIAGINKVRNRKNNPVKFDYYQYHILGVATPTDYFQFALVQRAAERFHNIPLHVTFDSSKVFRGQAAGAFMDFMTKHKIIRVDFKSSELKNNVEGTTLSNETVLRALCKKLDEKYGYVSCLDEDIYIHSHTEEEIEKERVKYHHERTKFINNMNTKTLNDAIDNVKRTNPNLSDEEAKEKAIETLVKKNQKLKDMLLKLEEMPNKKCLNKKYWTRIIQLSYISMNASIEEAMLVADTMIDIYLAKSIDEINLYADNYFTLDAEPDENGNYPAEIVNQFPLDKDGNTTFNPDIHIRKNLPHLTKEDYEKINMSEELFLHKKEVINKIIRDHLSKMNRNKNTSNLASKSENIYEAIDLLYTLDEERGFLINQRLLPEHEIFKHNSNLSFLPDDLKLGTKSLSQALI